MLKIIIIFYYIDIDFLISFMFILLRNLSKTRDALDLISLDNIDLLNEWICEEPNLLDGEDMSWRVLTHVCLL